MYQRILSIFLFFLATSCVFSNEVEPINNKFIDWQKKSSLSKDDTFILQTTKNGNTIIQNTYSTGWIPSPLAEEVHSKQSSKVMILSEENYPSKFDLSDPNLDKDRSDSTLSPIKNQGACGVCWAFASYGAYEGALSASNQGLFDFSEQHLDITMEVN